MLLTLSKHKLLILLCLLTFSQTIFAQNPSELTDTLRIGGGTIQLTLDPHLPVPESDVKNWTERAATAITHFYGRYPVKNVSIHVSPGSHGRVNGGVEINGEQINIHLGPHTTRADLEDDWMLTHEMFHLSQPDLNREYSWMSEGMADYLEPVARAQTNQITPEHFWKDLVEGLPKGLPQPGDQGLDHTHTWARTYWGGELFWFLADLRIRQQTKNQKSIRDAAQAVLNAGGDGSQQWSLENLLAIYDQGTGTTIFKDLHDELATKPGTVDLAALWKSLGIIYESRQVTFDDRAPLASIRRALTE